MVSNGRLIRAVLIAGVVAALVAGVFHLAVSERYVDQAIELEEQAQAQALLATGGTNETHEPVFSRRTQKAGLFAGLLLYGLATGAIFAGVYALAGEQLPGQSTRSRVAALAGATLVAAVLIPFLKYPANPPGVGDPDTLARRQLLYVGCLLLSVAGLLLAARLARALRGRLGTQGGLLAGAAFFVLWAAALLLLLPDRTDPINTPSDLLAKFRGASLAGQVLFWLVFAALFAAVLDRPAAGVPVAGDP